MKEAEFTMYERLLSLPLFQGLSKNDITNIVDKVKFHFIKHSENEVVIKQGDSCEEIFFLLEGELFVETQYDNYDFSVQETITAPCVIEPYSLFGKETYYSSTYLTKSPVNLMGIDKQSMVNKLYTYNVFRLNYLNILSGRMTDLHKALTLCVEDSVEKKIVYFIQRFSTRASGEISLNITMEQIASLLGETRINVSRVLNAWCKAHLIELKRKKIAVNDFKKLQNYILC